MNGGLKPFWRYYGGKWRAAPRYPKPRYPTIIEPFAGAAGYSLRYPDRNVILVEKYAVVAEIWRYLIGASAQEIRAIPLVEHVDALPSWVPQGGRWLVGFAMNTGNASPTKTLGAGCKRFLESGQSTVHGWTEAMRERCASQVDRIRHWQVIEGDYTAAPNECATWFVDAPYQKQGKYYKHGPDAIDFASLGMWSRERREQVIVCENEGADWLPFRTFMSLNNGPWENGKRSHEVIWTNDVLPLYLVDHPIYPYLSRLQESAQLRRLALNVVVNCRGCGAVHRPFAEAGGSLAIQERCAMCA